MWESQTVVNHLVASAWEWSTLDHLQTVSAIILITFFIVIFGGDILALVLHLVGIELYKIEAHQASTAYYLQAISIAFTSTPPFVGPLINFFCVLYLHRIWWWYIPYLLYAWLDPRPYHGGAKWHWFRRLRLWKHSADYFPVTLAKHDPSVTYTADKPYLIGYHPHGVLGAGAVLTFACDTVNLASYFPDMDISICTLNILFRVPFLRDWVLAQGFISASRDSIRAVLSRGRGHGVAVVIGGAKEASLTNQKVCELILMQRKGFFREGLRYGCRLVPVFCFGENKVYNIFPVENDCAWGRLSTTIQRWLGFSLPAFAGRGIMQRRWGLIPRRHPLTPVFGLPVDCPRITDPTDEDIRKVQEQYCANLRKLFQDMKARGIPGSADVQLRIV